MAAMTEMDVKRQSESALAQWGEKWRLHAKVNSYAKMKSMEQFRNTGVGRAVLSIANGYSFEENLEIIKKYQGNVDILCCDKTLKGCIDNGIIPTYCMVCDASVSYPKYMESVEDKLQDTILFMNVCANPEWAANGNWKDKFYYVNKDCLQSELEFQAISGCPNMIAAGTNVSNAQIILLTQCDNRGKNNFFGYDKILLIGYDYSWQKDKYYAFDGHGNGKQHYMKQAFCFSIGGDYVFSSANLVFSAKWLEKYVGGFKITAIQCSKRSIFRGFREGDLAEQMQYSYKPEHSAKVLDITKHIAGLQAKIDESRNELFNIDREHFKQVMRTI